MEYSYIIQEKNPLKELLFGGFIFTMGIFILPLITLYGYYINSLFRIIDGERTPPKWNIIKHFKMGVIPTILTGILIVALIGMSTILSEINAALIVAPIILYLGLLYITPAVLSSRHRTDISTIQLVLRKEYIKGSLLSTFTIIGSTVGGGVFLFASYSYFIEMIATTDVFLIMALFAILLVIVPTYAILTVISILTHIGIVMWGGRINKLIVGKPSTNI